MWRGKKTSAMTAGGLADLPINKLAHVLPVACRLDDLPIDTLAHVLYRLPLAHDIGSVAPVSRAFRDAARHTFMARPYSGEVFTIDGHEKHPDRVQNEEEDNGIIRTHGVAVAVTPDGHIITAAEDATIKVWSAGARRQPTCVRTIELEVEWFGPVSLLPGGTQFLYGKDDIVQLWNIDGSVERSFDVADVDSRLFAIVALPDGLHFAVGFGADYYVDTDSRTKCGDVELYSIDGTLVHAFRGHTDQVRVLTTTRDGLLISGADDNLVKVWSVSTKSLLSTCTGHTGGNDEGNNCILALAATPNGKRIISSADDTTVRVWLLNGTLENTFEELRGAQTIPGFLLNPVEALVALPDNQHALAGADNVKLFDLDDGAVLRIFATSPTSLALMPDGLRFVRGSMTDNNACIFEHGLAPQCWHTREELEFSA